MPHWSITIPPPLPTEDDVARADAQLLGGGGARIDGDVPGLGRPVAAHVPGILRGFSERGGGAEAEDERGGVQ